MTRRVKKRYIALSSEPKTSPEILSKAVVSSYVELFGILGLSSAHLKSVRSYPDRGIVVIQCALESVPRLLLAAAAITQVNSDRIAVRVLTISGTLKSIKEKLKSMGR